MPELAELEPMLLEEVRPALAPDGDEWTAEIKFDGYRVLAATGADGVRLKSRNGADATSWYPELQSLSVLPAQTIMDGEVCVLDDLGRSDFMRLQARSRRRRLVPGGDLVVFCAFDLLVLRGRDVRAWPLKRRKISLARLLAAPPAQVLFVADLPGKVHWLYGEALALKLEGVVAKRLASTYQAGARSPDWVKVKRPGAVPAERFRR